MFLLATILNGIAHILHILFTAYTWVVIISALLSWVRPDPYSPIVRTLRALTEPVFWRVRKHLPFVYVSGIDLSPVVVLLTVQFLDMVLIECLRYVILQMQLAGTSTL